VTIQEAQGGTISFRFVSIPTEGGSVGGFALWCNSEEDAKRLYAHIHRYITAAGDSARTFAIEFSQDSATTHRLNILIAAAGITREIHIEGIDSQYVDRLRESLQDFPAYFILAGYADEDLRPQFLPVSDYNFVRREIEIDGERVVGTKKNRWPIELFRTSSPLVREEGRDGSSHT
jgi:hypothetical protein